jgi:hypothetical protein
LRQLLPAQLSLSSRLPSTWSRRRAKGLGPCRKPDSALSRLMGVRVSVDVGGCSRDADFRRILVGACRTESNDVGVGWGKDWGKRSKPNWLTSSTRGCRQRSCDGPHGIATCVRSRYAMRGFPSYPCVSGFARIGRPEDLCRTSRCDPLRGTCTIRYEKGKGAHSSRAPTPTAHESHRGSGA